MINETDDSKPISLERALTDEITNLLARCAHLEDMIDIAKGDTRLLAIDIATTNQGVATER